MLSNYPIVPNQKILSIGFNSMNISNVVVRIGIRKVISSCGYRHLDAEAENC